MENEKLYNLDFVREMSGGNDKFVKQLVALFIETVPESIRLINEYYEANDLENLGKEAHKLKSTINTVQVPAFSEKIKVMEEIGKTGAGVELLPELMQDFNAVLPEVVEQIREEL